MKLKAFVLAVLSVLMMVLPMIPGGLPQASAQSFDDARAADLAEIVAAYEAYGATHGTYKIPGAGYEKRGYAWFNAGGTENYPFSLADALVVEGLLNANDVPQEPSSGSGYATYLCEDRIGVFSIDDDLTTDADDLAWWNANCRSTPFSSWDRTYMHLSDPFPYQGPVSTSPVSDIVAAIEAYGQAHHSYVIHDAGYDELGYGWFSRSWESSYKESVMNRLMHAGFLDANNLPEDPDALSSISQGLYVRRCLNRVGVFALPTGETGSQPSAEDAQWWADNNCNTVLIDDYDHTYFEVTEPLDYDQIRLDASAEIIAAMNQVSVDTHAIFLDDMGYDDDGRGWYSFENGTSYDLSIANGLAQAGYLSPFDLPAEDPFESLDYSNGYISFYCDSRRAVFTRSGGIEPTVEDAAWWTDNNCPMPSSQDHTFYVLTDELPLDQIRQQTVSTIVEVFEDFGRDNFTYLVPDSGYQDDGYGSFNAERGLYDISIANGLIRDGYLQPDVPLREPLSRDGSDSNGIRVYQCEDRVGVFTLADTITPFTDDSTWWTDNDCPAGGFNSGRSYFQLSEALPLDEERQTAIVAVIAAFEEYATTEGTFLIDGAGYQGDGGSWFTRTTSDYDPNVATALIDAGVLIDPAPEDPLRHVSYENGLRVEHCNDRVGVFAMSNGAQPTPEDAQFWADNNCPTTSADIGHTYFALSEPASDLLIPLTNDELRLQAIAQTVAALESYGSANGTYTLPAGLEGAGEGAYQASDASNSSIADLLVTNGHVSGEVLTDPLYNDTDGSAYDFQIYPCGNRVGVFSQADALTTYSDDIDWWTHNNCDATPLATHGYFQLASALDVLDEPYVIVYSASSIPGFKKATILVQPQNGPIGLAYATVTVTNPTQTTNVSCDATCMAESEKDGPTAVVNALGYVAKQAEPGETTNSVGCDGICAIEPDTGKGHLFAHFPEGAPDTYEQGHYVLPDDQEIVVEIATVPLEDLAQPGSDSAALNEYERFLHANDFMPPRAGPDGPDWDDNVGLVSSEGTNLSRCEGYSNSHWNFNDVDLLLPEDLELQSLGGGFTWTWSRVEQSLDCYDWKTWANYKNGNRVSGSKVSRYDSGRAANVPEQQLDSRTAELCLEVTPTSWVDAFVGVNYLSPNHTFYSNDDTPEFALHCMPADRNWGGNECPDLPKFTDKYSVGDRKQQLMDSGCFDEFLFDVDWDGDFDADDMRIIELCSNPGTKHAADLDCSLFNIDLNEASTGPADIERPDDDTVIADPPESSNGELHDARLFIDGKDHGFFPGVDGPVTFDIPPNTDGEICIVFTETGPDAQALPSRTCLDFFTIQDPFCGALSINVEVTNNSLEVNKTYTVQATAVDGSARDRFIGADNSGVVPIDVPELGEYEITVTENGEPIAHPQTAVTAHCGTIDPPTCDGTITAQVNNLKSEPTLYELVVRSGSVVIATQVTPSEIPAGGTGTISVHNVSHGTYDIFLKPATEELPPAIANIDLGDECDTTPSSDGFQLDGRLIDGTLGHWNPYDIEPHMLKQWVDHLEYEISIGGYTNHDAWALALIVVKTRLLQASRPRGEYDFDELRDAGLLDVLDRGTSLYIPRSDTSTPAEQDDIDAANLYIASVRADVATDFELVINRADATNRDNRSELIRNIRSLRIILGVDIGSLISSPQATAADFAKIGLPSSAHEQAVSQFELLTLVDQFSLPLAVGLDPFEAAEISDESEDLLHDLMENFDRLNAQIELIDNVNYGPSQFRVTHELGDAELSYLADFDPGERLIPGVGITSEFWAGAVVIPFDQLGELHAMQALANELVNDPVAFNLIAGATGSGVVQGDLNIDRTTVRGYIDQGKIDRFKISVWIEPYLRPYINEIDIIRNTSNDDEISARDYMVYIEGDPPIPEFLRQAIIDAMGEISDRTLLDAVHKLLQVGSVIVSGLILIAGGPATLLGKTLFALAIVLAAGELTTSLALDDDWGAVFAIAGIVFDSADVVALARHGLKTAAADIPLGTSSIRVGEALADLPDDVSHIMGDILAAGRHIENPTLTLDLADAVGVDAASAIRAVDPGDQIEQGLATAIVAHTKGNELGAIFTDLSTAESREIAGSLLQGQIAKLPQQSQDAFRTVGDFLDAAPQSEIDGFITDLVGALNRNWDNPELAFDEMAALYRATSADSALTDPQLLGRFDDGLRYDPASPNAWPRIVVCQSFSADTLVLLANGTHKAIAEIEVGDMVLATNPERGETGPREVSAVWPHHDTLLDLHVEGGLVTTTEDHRFWNHTDQAWQETQNIDIGDQLLTANDTTVTVEGLDWSSSHTATAYDLTVTDHHTFYVNTGNADVLVHNCISPSDPRISAALDDTAGGPSLRSLGLTEQNAANSFNKYPGSLSLEAWLDKYKIIKRNQDAGGAFEGTNLASEGATRNHYLFDADGDGFIPDGVFPEGATELDANRFIEIKNVDTIYGGTTSNAARMLRWARDNKGDGFVFTLIMRTDTTLSQPLLDLIDEVEAVGISVNQVRRAE